MKNVLYNVLHKTIKIVHALLWFPLSPLIGPDFPQRFLFRGRRKKQTQTGPAGD